MRRKQFGISLAIAGLAVTASVMMTSASEHLYSAPYNRLISISSHTSVFPSGITVEGESLEGKTLDEAVNWIKTYAETRTQRYIVLSVYNDNKYEYNASDFGIEWLNTDIVTQLETFVADGNFIEQYKKHKDLQVNPIDFEVQVGYNEAKVKSTVQALADQFGVAAVDATVRRENGQFIVSPEIEGKQFDVDTITAELMDLLKNSEESVIEYELPYIEDLPKYTAEYFNFSPTPLGSYATDNLGTYERTTNIAISAAGINGTVLLPGESASALDLYGAMTEENGYQMAPGYEMGKQVQTRGGGICQTTTTLYNALLRAELTILERHNHSMIVTYVPPALDAAVAPGGKDLKFRNDLQYPVYLEGYVADGRVVMNVWGVETRPANRTLQFIHQNESVVFPDPLYNIVVSNEVCAYGSNQPMGSKTRAEVETHPAVKARSYKIVYVDGIEQSREQLNYDYYEPMVGLYYVASDCMVTNSIYESTDPSAVYKYLGWGIFHGVYFKDGTGWNPNAAQGHYSP